MIQNAFVLKGTICCSADAKHLTVAEDSYAVCENGISRGIFSRLPEAYQNLPCHDYTGKLILPGLIDLHVHAPQYSFRGIGMDLELIDWLNTHTFPEEGKYAELSYAGRAYDIFTRHLVNSATTRACIFATTHVPATLLLMEQLERSGLCGYVGKVNMDRNVPDVLRETAEEAAVSTQQWIQESTERFQNIRPILTPRFIPACSDRLMAVLSDLQREYHLPLQSHLSENLSEIQWVRELSPESRFYGDAYERFGLFGGACPTIMAHCVHSAEAEIQLMKEQGVFIAHCPESNMNLASGVAPVRRYLEEGIHVGLGSDVAAGTGLSMFRAMANAIQCSKLRWRLLDQSLPPLSVEEVFYLATKGGGAFFGKVGSLEAGYEFDAVVLDDAALETPLELSPRERLERLIYLEQDGMTRAKYVRGRQLFDCTQNTDQSQ